MANSSISQAVNRQTVAAALKQARIEAAEHQQWITAINKAAVNLEACPWWFDGTVLCIASTTGARRYTVDAHGCECPSGQHGRPCWHRAAHRLLCKAAEVAHARQNNPDPVRVVSPLDARQNSVDVISTVSPLDARQNDVDKINVVSPMAATTFASLTAIANAELF